MDLQSRTTPASVVSPSSTTDSSRSTNASDATTNMKPGHKLEGGDAASPQLKIDITAPSDDTVDGCSGQHKNISCAISTLSTSDYDLCIPSSISCETTTGMWVRSESINSVPSWASTISLDSQTDETVIEFIRRFLSTLFDNPEKISLELKSEFGQVVRVSDSPFKLGHYQGWQPNNVSFCHKSIHRLACRLIVTQFRTVFAFSSTCLCTGDRKRFNRVLNN